MEPSEPLGRVAEMVKRRRLELGLSQEEAAKLGDMSENTWRKLESYGKPVSELKKAGITQALGWRSDAIEHILAGADPPEEADVRVPLKLDLVNPKETIEDRERKVDRMIEELQDEKLKILDERLARVEELVADILDRLRAIPEPG